MNPIKIIVCAKQVPDPEAPANLVEIDSDTKMVKIKGLPPGINSYDQNAIEAALKIKEKTGAKVTVVSVGSKLSQSILRKALAVGVDDLVLVDDSDFKDLDSRSTADVLSKAIEKIGEYDLVFTGRQASDWDSGQTGLILGEMLGIPIVNLVGGVTIEDRSVSVKRMIPGGYERVKGDMPVLLTISNEVGEMRVPSLRTVLESRKRPIEVWQSDDLKIDTQELNPFEILALTSPPNMERECSFIEGDSPEERGENLAMTLKKAFLKNN
ncbi:electron transfer flavoprotein subunit beta/FixA family protein [Desulfobacula sp.]|uniref:electron transfer flavoprotein subunit beta/FixA family protein n=1 Tax=Desulfobacula sp. TaxID=2593537 RepID=UPI0026384451|nr:electron transfer flavoprotein subunit beta/FixA family protein [Desulfobacula sp.]